MENPWKNIADDEVLFVGMAGQDPVTMASMERDECAKALGGTFQKDFYRDQQGNEYQYDAASGVTEEDWLKEQQQFGIQLTKAGENERPTNYIYQHKMYDLGDGQQVYVREDEEEEFHQQAQKNGWAPKALTSRRWNGVEVTGDAEQLLNLQQNFSQDGYFDDATMVAMGASEEQILTGQQRMQELVQKVDEQVKARGKMDFFESEANRSTMMHGRKTSSTADQVDTYWQTFANALSLDLAFTPQEITEKYGNTDALEKVKDMGWFDSARLFISRIAPGGEDIRDIGKSDEEFAKDLQKRRQNQLLAERIAGLRGQTFGAQVGSGTIDMAALAIDMTTSALAAAAITGTTGGLGTAALAAGLYGAGHAADEYGRQTSERVWFNPLTGRMEKASEGREGLEAVAYTAGSIASNYVIEKVGGKVVGGALKFASKPLKKFTTNLISKEMSTVLGLSPGLVKSWNVGGPLKTKMMKIGRAYHALTRNSWGKVVQSGIRGVSPSGFFEEMNEELLQAGLEGGLNLSGEADIVKGEIAKGSWSAAGEGMLEVLKSAPQFATTLLLYNVGAGPISRGMNTAVNAYGTRATLANALKWSGEYTAEEVRAMTRDQIRDNFKRLYMTGDPSTREKIVNEFLKRHDTAEGMLGELQNHEISDFEVKADEKGQYTVVDKTNGKTYAGNDAVRTWAANKLGDYASAFGELVLRTEEQQAKISRAIMFVNRTDIDNVIRQLQETGATSAFETLGNSAELVDSMQQAMALRQLSEYSAYQDTPMQHLLRAQSDSIMRSVMEDSRNPDAETMGEFFSYLNGISVDAIKVNANDIKPIFKAEDFKGAKVGGSNALYVEHGDIRITKRTRGGEQSRDYKHGDLWYVQLSSPGKKNFAKAFATEAEAISYANELAAKKQKSLERHQAMKFQAEQVYDKLFGNKTGGARRMTVLENPWQDREILGSIEHTLRKNGVSDAKIPEVIASIPGLTLEDGTMVVFTDNCSSLTMLTATIRHEGFHAGVKSLYDLSTEKGQKQFIAHARRIFAKSQKQFVLRDALGNPLTPEQFSKMSISERANVLDETCAYLCEVMATKPGMSDKITLALSKMFGTTVGWGNLSARQRENEARAIISSAFSRVHNPTRIAEIEKQRAEKRIDRFALPPAMSDEAFKENARQREAENQAAWSAYSDQTNEVQGGDVDFSGTGRGARRRTFVGGRDTSGTRTPSGDYKRRRDNEAYSIADQMGDHFEDEHYAQEESRAWEERRAEKDVRDSETRADSHAVTRYDEAVDKSRQTDQMYREERASQRAEGAQAQAALNKEADDIQAAEEEYSRDLLEDATRQSPRTSASVSEYVNESETRAKSKKSKKERRAERRAAKEKAKQKKENRGAQGKSGFANQTRDEIRLAEEESAQLEQDALEYVDDVQSSLNEDSYFEKQARLQEEADAAWAEWLDEKEAEEDAKELGSYLADDTAKAQEDADWKAHNAESQQEDPSKVRAYAHFETQFAQLVEQDEQEEELYRNRRRELESGWARHEGDAPISGDPSKAAVRRRRSDLEEEKASRQKLQKVVEEEPKPIAEAVLWREIQEANDLHDELTGGIEGGKPLHPAHRKALDAVNGQIIFLTQLADALEAAQPSENAQQKKEAIEALREKAGAPEASAIVPPVQQEEAAIEEDVVEDDDAPVPQETKTEPVAETPVDAPVAEVQQQKEQSSPEPTLEQTIQEVVTEAEESVIDLAEVREEIRKEYDAIKELWDSAAAADEKIREKLPTRIGKLSATDTFNLVLDAYISQKYGTSLLKGSELTKILYRAGNIGDVQEAIDWLVGAWQKSPDEKIRNAFAEMEPMKYKKPESAVKPELISRAVDELGELVYIRDKQGLAAKMENIGEAQKTRNGTFVRLFGIQLPGLSVRQSAELIDHINIATNNTLNRSDSGYGTVIKNTEALLDKLLSALEKKLPGWKIVEKAKEGYVLPEKYANALVALNHEEVRKHLGSATTRSEATKLLREWMPYFPKGLLEVVPVKGNKKGLKAPKGRYILKGFYFGDENTYSAPIDIETEVGEDGKEKKKAKYAIQDGALTLSNLVQMGDVRPISTLKGAIDADVDRHAETFKSLVKETPDGKTLEKTARQYVYDTIDAINKLRSIGFEGDPGILSGTEYFNPDSASKSKLPPKPRSTVNVEKKGKGRGGASITVTADGDVDVSFKMASPVERRKDLIGLHNITPEKLIGAGFFGGFAMPSIAIVKDTMGHNKFGDITLIMRKDAFDPEKNEKNVISSRDIYSPIFPTKEELDKLRASKGRDITLQDIVELMDRGLRRGISGAAGATIAKDFSSLKDVIKFEKLLRKDTKEESDEAFVRFDALVDRLIARTQDLELAEEALTHHFDIANGNVKAMAEGLLKDEYVTTKEEATAIARELKAISELPVPYFEGKLYREVLFDEVAAAVVPYSYVMTQPEVMDTLDAYDIETYFYTDKDAQSRLESVNDAADVVGAKFKMTKAVRANVTNLLTKKRPDLTAEQRNEIINVIEHLGEVFQNANAGRTPDDGKGPLAGYPKYEQAAAKWFVNTSVSLPKDGWRIAEALRIANKHKADPMAFSGPAEIFETFGEQPREEKIDPDTIPEFYSKEVSDNGKFVVYKVGNTREAQAAVRRIVDNQWGKQSQPWCLITRTDINGKFSIEYIGKDESPAELDYSEKGLEKAWDYWNRYNDHTKRIGFYEGKLVGFDASSNRVIEWWNREDQSERYPSVISASKLVKEPGVVSSRYIDEETGELFGEERNIHRGSKRNGLYEEWNEDGVKTHSAHYKDGVEHGWESYFVDGKPSRKYLYHNGYRTVTELFDHNGNPREGVVRNFSGYTTAYTVYKNGRATGDGYRVTHDYDNSGNPFVEEFKKITYNDGKKVREQDFSENTMYVKDFDEIGIPKHEVRIETHGHISEAKLFHKNGVEKAIFYVRKGEIAGPLLVYNESGDRIAEAYVEEGALNGRYVEYENDGELKFVAVYRNGVLDGDYNEYSNGKKIADAYFQSGDLAYASVYDGKGHGSPAPKGWAPRKAVINPEDFDVPSVDVVFESPNKAAAAFFARIEKESRESPEGRSIEDTKFKISRLYTGSSADYRIPSLHYIGTGEGNQVYGYGLYASNRRSVAESYAKNDANEKGGPHRFTLGGDRWETPYDPYRSKAKDIAARAIIYSNGDFASAHKKVRESLEKYLATGATQEKKDETRELAQDVNALLNEWEKDGLAKVSEYIYEQTFFTNRPEGDESHLLNWYAESSEEQIDWIKRRAAAEGLSLRRFNSLVDRITATGEDIYRAITEDLGSPQSASEFLARADIDGVKYPVGSYKKAIKDGDKAGWNYVSFRDDNISVDHKWKDGQMMFKISPAQLKMFGAETMANYNERIHRLRMQFPDFAQAAYDKVINYQGPLFRAYRKIAKGKQIADSENVEAAAKNVHGKIRAKSEEVHRKYVQPLLDTIKKYDLDVEKLDDYLYAKFAPERNLMIAQRTIIVNAETGELETMTEDGSGMSNAEAKALMNQLASDPKRKAYEEAMRLVWKMNAESARRMVQYGFVRESQAKTWAEQSPHYVPLKDLDTVRFILRRSTGRKTRAASPLAGSIWQAQTVIRSGEVSEVNKTLARFVKKYDPKGEQMGGRVMKHSGERKGVFVGEPVFVPYGSEAERELREAGIKLVETEESKELGGAFVAQSSLYDKVGDKLVPNKLGVKVFTTKTSAPNAATYFENGVRKFVVFDKENKEAMRIAEAINRKRLLTPNDSDAMRGAWNLAQRLLRWKADISTTLNPRFILRNMGADFFNTSMIMMTEGKWKELGGFAKNYVQAMKVVRDFAKGKDIGGTEIGRYYLEARRNGMLTGVFGEGSFKEASHKLGRDISKLQGKSWRKAWESFKDFMETIGSYPEQGARLSAYIAMRKSGMTPAQAAQYGREVSVDFNAKGELTPVINALYMFSNAGAQGIARAFTALKTGAEARGGGLQGYARAATPGIAASIVLGFISSMMMDAVGDDDDDEEGAIGSLNDRLPDYVKAQNINIPLGGDAYLQLPTRGSFQPFIHFGSLFYDFTQGKRDAGEVVAGFTESLRDSVDFIGGNSPTLGQWLTPTVFDPMVQILEGKDWTGKDLYRQSFGQKAPQSSLGKSGTSNLYKWMAEQLSRKTGGDDVEGGLVDMHPETYKLLTEFFVGSLGTMVGDVTATVGATMGGEFNVKNIPVVGGVARQAPGRESQYYSAYSEFDDISKKYAAYLKAAREASNDASRKDNFAKAEAMKREYPWIRSANGLRKMGKTINDLRQKLKTASPARRKALEQDIKGKERYFIKQINQSR